jgi:hypothetical protein
MIPNSRARLGNAFARWWRVGEKMYHVLLRDADEGLHEVDVVGHHDAAEL